MAAVIEDDEAVAEYVLGFIDRHGIASVKRLVLSIKGDDIPSKEALAEGLTETVVIRNSLNGDYGIQALYLAVSAEHCSSPQGLHRLVDTRAVWLRWGTSRRTESRHPMQGR